MTRDEMKKLINYQFQLTTFALGLAEEQQNNSKWLSFATSLIDIGLEMMADIQKEIRCH